MNVRHSVAAMLSVALSAGAVAACGTDEVGAPPGPTGPEPTTQDPTKEDPTTPDPKGGDVTAPTILSMTPEDGASKLKEDVKIVITFSEPMNKAKSEAAFTIDASSSTSGPPTFSWNEQGTVLIVDPKAQYSTGDDSATAPPSALGFSMGTGAADLAGNTLAAGAAASASLYRRINQVAPRHDTLFGNSPEDSDNRKSFIGAGEGSAAEEARRGYVSFVLPVLPTGAELHQATLEGTIRDVKSAFVHFGDMYFEHFTFDAIDATTYGKPALSDLGVFIAALPAPAIDDPVAKDVTDAVADDYANGRALSQYRLLFKKNLPKIDGTDDLAHIKNGAGEVKISLSYLIE